MESTTVVTSSSTNPMVQKNFEEYYRMDNKVGQIILTFFVLVAIFWVLLYTFNPGIVQGPDSSKKYVIKGDPNATTQEFAAIPDTSRCFVGALVLALICVTLLWLFRSCY